MRLAVVTPQGTVVDRDVVHVRAEDRSGAFGVLDRHADLLTALTVCVVAYRSMDRVEHFVAVRGGLLTVRRTVERNVSEGCRVEILTREAIAGDDLHQLQEEVLGRFRRSAADETSARQSARRLEGALLRRVADFIRDERQPPIRRVGR